MNSLLEISSPVTIVETGRANKIKSVKSWYSSTLEHSQNNLSTEFLINPARLQEIYDLRLEVWEHSGESSFVNRKLFPNGWYDNLDETALHWVTFNDQNKIVAAARLNIFHSLEDSPYYASMKHLLFPTNLPFAFYSRLVVHPQYRKHGLSRQLYDGRAQFCKEKENVIVVAGKLNLKQELDLISNLNVMLSMDSGNAHIAAMLGIKVITLWGATHPFAGFKPFNQPMENCLVSDREQFPLLPTSVYGNKKVEGYEDVMRSISIESVVEKIQQFIK